MRNFKLAARMLSGAAMAALAACATAPEVPTSSEPAPMPPPPPPPPAAAPAPIDIDRNAGSFPDEYLELEDMYESLPPTGAGAPPYALPHLSELCAVVTADCWPVVCMPPCSVCV